MLEKRIQRHIDLLVQRYPVLISCVEDIEKTYLILEECCLQFLPLIKNLL